MAEGRFGPYTRGASKLSAGLSMHGNLQRLSGNSDEEFVDPLPAMIGNRDKRSAVHDRKCGTALSRSLSGFVRVVKGLDNK